MTFYKGSPSRFIRIAEAKPLHWRKVDNMVCMSAYYGKYFFSLCKYTDSDGIPKIRFSVDDIARNASDIVDELYDKSDTEYLRLEKIYNTNYPDAEVISSDGLEYA